MRKLMLLWLPVSSCWQFAFGDPNDPSQATLTDWRGTWSVASVGEAEEMLAGKARLTAHGTGVYLVN